MIIVGWGKGADILNYMKAVANTRMMGMEISHIMANLVQNGGASLDKMWCVGHSLGAHICGRAGKEQKYGHITGGYLVLFEEAAWDVEGLDLVGGSI